ncbi:MAG: HDIG domain-containing protein [Phycisphaerales bacterium]|nr:MAG: HDIG domain-containing protein [Phycisphaerales bacterium]
MASWMTKRKIRRQQVREQRAKASGTWQTRLLRRVASWPVLVSALFILAASAIALLGEVTLGYSVGQNMDKPIYARVDFQVPDEEQTAADKEAARASTPSCYTMNPPALTFDRIRADLIRVYQAAVDADTFEKYSETLGELGWPAVMPAYQRLRDLGDEAGRSRFQGWVDGLPLEEEYVVRGLFREDRDPDSAKDFIRLEIPEPQGDRTVLDIRHADLVPHGNEKALRGAAGAAASKFSLPELTSTVEAVVLAVFRDQPTILYNRDRTVAEMRKAEEAMPVALTTYEKEKPFVNPGVLGPEDYELLRAEHAAYLEFLKQDLDEAKKERQRRWLQRAGLITLVALLSIGLMAYTGLHQPRVLEVGSRTLAFTLLMLGTLLAARVLDMRWPQRPELVYAPCLLAGSVLAIAYPRRFAMGATCIIAVLASTVVDANLFFLLTLLTGVVVAVYQLDEIRSRLKLATSGAVTALAIMAASAGGGLTEGHSPGFIIEHAGWAGACALSASFVVSGMLPLVERLFRIATSLTLLEWRDPTRKLLQLLAREAPGTYNHSLALGTLAQAACERIGANGLLAQVGALYHDIGKIHKADYFAENQAGQISRHDNLAPTMSLLIILGHVKDGIEMAKEYKLPRVLHQFIEEHHGTTVVRYFHHVASEKQPHIAQGKHDREVPEAEFRYGGPKPRSRESAVLMVCDAVEGAVRALPEPTPSRIESVVHKMITDRLSDGQFDDCDITLKEISQVEDVLVKSLCAIYHGRVAYPKARKPAAEEPSQQERLSV